MGDKHCREERNRYGVVYFICFALARNCNSLAAVFRAERMDCSSFSFNEKPGNSPIHELVHYVKSEHGGRKGYFDKTKCGCSTWWNCTAATTTATTTTSG